MTFRAAMSVLVACLGVASSAVARPTDYTVVEIPTLPGHPIPRTSTVNDLGHAVGGNWTCPFILSCLGRAVLYDGSGVVDFSADLIGSVPPGFFGVTRGADINNAGDVVVWLTIVDVGLITYLWRDEEEFIEIEGPPGSSGAVAWALNGPGTVVGHAATPGGSRAFTWGADAGVLDVIEPPAGFDSSAARGINDAGDVVGAFSGGAAARGFVWSRGDVCVLDPLPGDVESRAVAINEAGLVVGLSTDALFNDHLVLWRDGAIADSVVLPFDDVIMEVHGINDEGVVVGNYWPLDQAFQHFAFRWSAAAGFQQLDELDLSIPDLNLWDATGVNESGQIVAWGEYPGFVAGSFLLTPVGLDGDVDGDGVVSIADLLAVLAAWGPCAGCPEDIDGDGVVGITDLLVLLANWT